MPALDGLPEEVLANVALHLGEQSIWFNRPKVCRANLLAFRCASKACDVAVRRAAKDHVTTKRLTFRNATAQSIAACGRVIGSGCQDLTSEVDSAEALPALRHFVVVTTGGRLTDLSLNLFKTSPISASMLLEMCRACPLLTDLEMWHVPSVTNSNEDRERFAAELGRACQRLERVDISGPAGISPAESYQMYFPRIKQLEFWARNSDGAGIYEPTRYDRIEATATACVGATGIMLTGCFVTPNLVEALLQTSLKGRLTTLDFGPGLEPPTTIMPETILQCVAGFDALTEVSLPDHISADPEFYASLARARPTLREIDMGWFTEAGDECVRTVVEQLALESIDISHMDNLTPAVIDIILQSRSAQTLKYSNIYDTPIFTSATVLRLVRGCPRLANVTWGQKRPPASPIDDGANVAEINALLKARGTEWGEVHDCFPQYGPSPRYG